MLNQTQKYWANRFAILSLAAVVLMVDQLSKSWAHNLIAWPLDFGILKFIWWQNTGVAFGINLSNPLIIFSIMIFLLILLWLFWAFKNYSRIYYLGLALSFGGGISNLIDRWQFGFVRDFIAVGNFPIFNIADGCIVIGLILAILSVKIKHFKRYAKKQEI